MSRYRKLDPRFWRDEKVRAFDPLDKLVAVYAFTGQSNRIGCFVFSEGMGSEDTGIPPRTFGQRFRNVCQNLDWRYDEARRVLYLPTWWKYNQPENPNVLISNLRDLDELPDSPIVTQFCESVAHLREELHETFRATLAKRSPQRMADQEQEQEQEQELPLPPHGGRTRGRQCLDTAEARSWIELLNREASRQFRFGDENLCPVQERMRAGFTLADAKLVVRGQVAAWRGTDWEKYLRPQTLFGTKFDSYLQAARADLASRNGHDPSDALRRQPIYRDADFDANGDVKPEAEAREHQRIAALTGPKD